MEKHEVVYLPRHLVKLAEEILNLSLQLLKSDSGGVSSCALNYATETVIPITNPRTERIIVSMNPP